MKETIVPANDCDLIPLVTLKNYPKQSLCIIDFIYDHLLIFTVNEKNEEEFMAIVLYITTDSLQNYSAWLSIGYADKELFNLFALYKSKTTKVLIR